MRDTPRPPMRSVGLRLGILCAHGTPALALRVNLEALIDSLAASDAPPEVVVLTDHEGTLDPALSEHPLVQVIRRPATWTWGRAYCLAFCGWWVRWNRRCERWAKTLEEAREEAHYRLAKTVRARPSALAILVLIATLLVIWHVVASAQILGALLWGLGFPLWMADRVMRRIEFALRRANEPILAANCDVWLVPYPNRWDLCDVPAVLLLSRAGQLRARQLPLAESKIPVPRQPSSPACLAVTLDGSRPWGWRQHWLGMTKERLRDAPNAIELDDLGATRFAEAWLDLFDDAMNLAPLQRGFDRELAAPWPAHLPARVRADRPLEAFLFLQIPWGGGNWEHTRELVAALAEINDRKRRLRLSLGVHLTQPNAWALESLGSSIPVQRFLFNAISRQEAARLEPDAPRWLPGHPGSRFAFFSDAAEAALRADAWLALSDRFPLPLLPARPYAVVVHDMIHLRVPEALGRAFFRNHADGIRPTIEGAARVIVTSPCTRDDVLSAYELPSESVELIPVACEPHRRFARLPAGFVPLPRRDFILNVTNASPHKGAELMLRAQAALKRRLGPAAPLLVLCGVNTEHLAPSAVRATLPSWIEVRALQRELGLREHHDVVFLGAVTDVELKDLYQRCRAVVNAARHDNGTYCMIEGAWFGKPVVSTCYPAAEFLAERFGLPIRFVPLNDAEALADALAQRLADCPPDDEALAHLRDPPGRPGISASTTTQRDSTTSCSSWPCKAGEGWRRPRNEQIKSVAWPVNRLGYSKDANKLFC